MECVTQQRTACLSYSAYRNAGFTINIRPGIDTCTLSWEIQSILCLTNIAAYAYSDLAPYVELTTS